VSWWSRFAERGAETFLPFVGHIAPHIVLNRDGSVMCVVKLHGRAHELASASERNAGVLMTSGLLRNIADDNITLYVHLIRRRQTELPPVPKFRNRFSADLMHAYRERVLRGRIFVNEWYLAIVVSPRNPVGGTQQGRALNRAVARARKLSAENAPAALVSQLDDLWTTIARPLESFCLRRLGLRERNGVIFSEIAETLRLILGFRYLPVPLVNGPLGGAIYTDRMIFSRRRTIEYRETGGSHWGRIAGLREYMAKTRPDTFDPIPALPMELVMTQSFGFLARPDMIDRLARKANQMVSAGDKAATQIAEINEPGGALDRLMGGEFVMGAHHFSLLVLADTLADLDGAAGLARTKLAESGAVIAEEANPGAMEPAVWAQLPGNADWIPRPGAATSYNFGCLASFAAFPAGNAAGYWGPAMIRFKTNAATSYDYAPHVGDVGMMAGFGRTGSGKSTVLCLLLALFDQYMADRPGAIVFFDKDRRGELLVHACAGKYLAIRDGEDSGLAPLRGFADTPYARSVLDGWLRNLILADERGPLPSADDLRIARAVAAVLRLPRAERSLLGLRQMLGWDDPLGAGPRLERWCRGGPLGWAFDGARDDVDLDGGIVGFDLTAILERPEIVNPAAQYLRSRILPLCDGRRLVISFDEAPQYMLHARFKQEIESFLKTLRGHNGLVMLVAQQPEDLLDPAKGTFGAALLGQCHTTFWAPTPNADRALYEGVLKFTRGEYRALTETMLPGSRKWLIRRQGENAESVVVDLDLSALPEFVAVLSGRAGSVRFAEALRREHGADWLREFQRRYKEAVE
jgi:type IV secretion system protein VirB4